MSSNANFFLLIPAMYALFALALAVTAVVDRRLVAARWAALGFVVAMASIIVDGYRVPGAGTWSSWFTVATHFIPLLIMIQAFLARHGRHAPVVAVAVTVVGCILVMPNVGWNPSHATRGWFVQAVCTAIILSGLPGLWTLRKRSAMDLVAFGVVAGAALSYGGRTVIMILNPIAENAAGIAEFYAGLNVVFHLASALMAMAVGITLIMAIGFDALRYRTQESEVDGLTKVGNRRMYDRLLAEHRVGKRCIGAAILIDLDHFKRINDTYGHTAGDEVLRRVGAQLKKLLSSFGRVCRVGGEEFVVLIDAKHAQAASALALTIRSGIAALEAPWDGQTGAITASVGFSRSRPGASLEESVRHADQAVYRAKSDGRDRVVGAIEEKGLMLLRAVA